MTKANLKAQFDEIVKKLQNKTSKPLKAIETIDTLKLINMLYRSSSKVGWIKNNKTIINSRLGN